MDQAVQSRNKLLNLGLVSLFRCNLVLLSLFQYSQCNYQVPFDVIFLVTPLYSSTATQAPTGLWYMLWFNFNLGSNFIFLCFWVW